LKQFISTLTHKSPILLEAQENYMSDDTRDDTIDLAHPADFEDLVSQRALAFCHVAKTADTVKNEAVRDQCMTMLRKLNFSIKAPSTAELLKIEGGVEKLARSSSSSTPDKH
jgi:hypothetical protein